MWENPQPQRIRRSSKPWRFLGGYIMCLISIVDELTSNGLVRLILKLHLIHLDYLAEWEKKWKQPSKYWDRSIQVLLSLVRILQRNELAQRVNDAQIKARPQIPDPKLSEEAQEVAKPSKLGRQNPPN
jgi:hypothetical protein